MNYAVESRDLLRFNGICFDFVALFYPENMTRKEWRGLKTHGVKRRRGDRSLAEAQLLWRLMVKPPLIWLGEYIDIGLSEGEESTLSCSLKVSWYQPSGILSARVGNEHKACIEIVCMRLSTSL